jgi:hypothetical protein
MFALSPERARLVEGQKPPRQVWSAPHSSATYIAFLVACSTGTFPATVVIATTRTSSARNAMMIATASSEAVSVSIRNSRGIKIAYHLDMLIQLRTTVACPQNTETLMANKEQAAQIFQ